MNRSGEVGNCQPHLTRCWSSPFSPEECCQREANKPVSQSSSRKKKEFAVDSLDYRTCSYAEIEEGKRNVALRGTCLLLERVKF